MRKKILKKGEKENTTNIFHDMLPHSQPLFLHFHHIILLVFWVIDLLQLKDGKEYVRFCENTEEVSLKIYTAHIGHPNRTLTVDCTSFVKRASSSCSSKTPSSFVSKHNRDQITWLIMALGHDIVSYMAKRNRRCLPCSLKKVLGLNSCGSRPSVSSHTSRSWATLPWRGHRKK